MITRSLWRASDSWSGKSQHFQTCSKPKGLRQACAGYLFPPLPLNNLHCPQNAVNIYVSMYIRSSDQTTLSSMTFLWLDSQKPLTRPGVIRCQAGCLPGSWAQLHTLGAETFVHLLPPSVAYLSNCPQHFASLRHIAVTEVKSPSVYTMAPERKDRTWLGGRSKTKELINNNNSSWIICYIFYCGCEIVRIILNGS